MENIEAVASPDEVHLVVGGYHYYLDADDLLRHPDSYFAHMLKDEWNKDKTATVTIDRNGKVYRYVHYYLFSGYMDPNRKPIYDLDVLIALRTEADFYGLSELVRMCDSRIRLNIDRVVSSQNSLGLSCFCVRASHEKSNDVLVTAMSIFRPATVATARLETYTSDSLESYHRDVAALLQTEQNSTILRARKCLFAEKCFMVGEHGFSSETKNKLYDAFSEWPCMTTDKVSHAYFRDQQVHIYETGGSCAGRVPFARNSYHDGTFLYIFNSEHTGGRVTTKVNGEEVSIEKPGECMALLPGCSYTVETVTSGHLVLFEHMVRLFANCSDTNSDHGDRGAEGAGDGIVQNRDGVDSGKKSLLWHIRDNYNTTITTERSAALTHAIDTALETYAGVVICLSTYYPAGHSTNKNRRCETDPALLKKFDAKLHAHLSAFYEVTVVTVTVAANTADEGGGFTAQVLDFPHDAEMQVKVVAPMQSVSSDKGQSRTMLLTGLLCFARS